jgi:hypothetical protein
MVLAAAKKLWWMMSTWCCEIYRLLTGKSPEAGTSIIRKQYLDGGADAHRTLALVNSLLQGDFGIDSLIEFDSEHEYRSLSSAADTAIGYSTAELGILGVKGCPFPDLQRVGLLYKPRQSRPCFPFFTQQVKVPTGESTPTLNLPSTTSIKMESSGPRDSQSTLYLPPHLRKHRLPAVEHPTHSTTSEISPTLYLPPHLRTG